MLIIGVFMSNEDMTHWQDSREHYIGITSNIVTVHPYHRKRPVANKVQETIECIVHT